MNKIFYTPAGKNKCLPSFKKPLCSSFVLLAILSKFSIVSLLTTQYVEQKGGK